MTILVGCDGTTPVDDGQAGKRRWMTGVSSTIVGNTSKDTVCLN